jgi:hypothetical protein
MIQVMRVLPKDAFVYTAQYHDSSDVCEILQNWRTMERLKTSVAAAASPQRISAGQYFTATSQSALRTAP